MLINWYNTILKGEKGENTVAGRAAFTKINRVLFCKSLVIIGVLITVCITTVLLQIPW